ncbi:hypothetical protein D9756_010350 [Leucocoprinus leucothites]|uniref:Uncharacterized protein n=1 Tax=Leucocoprinus leucothites TaxID=201217 RepID=A0A8H5CSF1_9AGAR|nr:hypothetical protein D9756_010350 [Leucoagaricus leucothites]
MLNEDATKGVSFQDMLSHSTGLPRLDFIACSEEVQNWRNDTNATTPVTFSRTPTTLPIQRPDVRIPLAPSHPPQPNLYQPTHLLPLAAVSSSTYSVAEAEHQ